MSRTISIIEHSAVYQSKQPKPGDNELSAKQYELLSKFISANASKGSGDIMEPVIAKDGRYGFRAKQFVGTITLKDGTNIEILPKIYNGSEGEKVRSKKVLEAMLRTLFNSANKNFQFANLKTSKMPLYEIFIRMFIDEVFGIVKKGLKGGYVTVSSNENALKGKLLFSRHIRENYVNKQKFFVEYDEFNNNQPENRLLKATLLYLDKRTVNAKNKQHIKTLLSCFDEVPASTDYAADFNLADAGKGRNSAHYQTALKWSRVFLQGKTFTAFAGKEYAGALLFDMNRLFESYIAAKLRRNAPRVNADYATFVQDKKYCLFTTPRTFLLKPDIVIRDKAAKKAFILDTKWKTVYNGREEKANGGITMSDMYQMFAYFKQYESHGENPESVTLIYPKMADTVCGKNGGFVSAYNSAAYKDVKVKVFFVELDPASIDKSIEALLKEITV